MPSHMNKFMAILFALGTIGFFGLSQRDSYQSQNQTRYGAPVGPVRAVEITQGDRNGYIVFGVICMTACIYFLARIRRG
jgi:hypothetical protein